jgi:hypothetical protein
VGFHSTKAAYGITVGTPGTKAVLLALAYRACDTCGLAWPGVPWLMGVTEMGDRRVRECLGELTKAGLLMPRGYATGGRSRATEYVVLPGVRELSTAPCGECESRRKNPALSAGNRRRRSGNPAPADGVLGAADAIPCTLGVENPALSAPHQSERIYQSGSASPPAVETVLSDRSFFDHPSEDPRAVAASQDALRTVGEILRQAESGNGPPKGKAQG